MIQKFNIIYYHITEYGYLYLIFFNEDDSSALKFDGVNFFYVKKFRRISEMLKLDYEGLNTRKNLEVVGIRQFLDVTLIKLNNDDIFQLYFTMDDETKPQKLSVFTIPKNSDNSSSIPSRYDEVLKNFNSANDDVEIDRED